MTFLLRHVSAGLAESYWSPCAATNSLRPSDTTWRHGTWSTNIQAMVCCPMAPSHCLNPYWLISSEVLWRSPKRNFSGNNQNICPRYDFDNYWYKLTTASHKDQWVKMYRAVGFRLLRLLTWINSSPPGQMAAVSQTILSSAFSWKVFYFETIWDAKIRPIKK